MRLFHLMPVLLFFVACGLPQTNNPLPEPKAIVAEVHRETRHLMDTPTNMEGSTFLGVLKGLSNTQRNDLLVSFTASSTVRQWGIDSVRNYYANTDFGFKILKLKSCVKSGNTYSMEYLIQRFGNSTQCLVHAIVERDSVRVLLPIVIK